VTARPRLAILGGGPAGVGGAYRVRALDRADVTVVEQRDAVGGNAGSFDVAGQRVDYGSHRLHPACRPDILADIRSLLGDELLERPRHGRIRLRGRWVRFPLRPLDLLLRLDPGFAVGAAGDMTRRILPGGGSVPGADPGDARRGPPAGSRPEQGGADADESFETVLRRRLGATICEAFYFPYARKIWGREPAELSATQARRRVSADSPAKLLRKVFGALLPGSDRSKRRFYYPRDGYGSISEAYADAARRHGAEIALGWTVTALERRDADAGSPRWTVVLGRGDDERRLKPDLVWSTIPVTVLARLVRPAAPPPVLAAARALDFRAMILVYLALPVDRFTEYDAHYFPGGGTEITRLSEPKVYADRTEPRGRTVVCAELPCDPDDQAWSESDEALAERVAADLARASIPLPARPDAIHVERLRFAYPIYARGYEGHFDTLDRWAEGLPGLVSYGRQGLFAHDNTHHALAMAYAAADCLDEGGFDAERWASYRRDFESHVVED